MSHNQTDLVWSEDKHHRGAVDDDPWNAHSGAMTFEFCTKNDLEARQWAEGNLFSNHDAAASWEMCKSTLPRIESWKESGMCGPGAKKIIFVGTDCWRDWAWYSTQKIGDPWMTQRDGHVDGCAAGLHVKPFLCRTCA